MSDPTFSIIVPTFRRPDALRKTLTALLALDYPRDRYEVIVVDDGADDTTAKLVYAFGDRGVPVRLAAQLRRGAASARNRGARLARNDWLLFCDDDIITPPSHLAGHRDAHARHPHALVAGTFELAPSAVAVLRATPFGRYRIKLENQFLGEIHGESLDGDSDRVRVPGVSAANLSMRRDLFWTIGGFDEDFPLAGAEDQDLSLRARAADALLVLDRKIPCFHNDHYLSRRAYCGREERSARTTPFLVRKYPAQFDDVPYARENRPITADDPPRLVLKKLVKAALASRPLLELLHATARVGEAARAPEALLRRLYAGLLGLHLFRGFRQSWST